MADRSACRARVVGALVDHDVETVCSRYRGRERRYSGAAATLLGAAGQFVEAVEFHDERLASRARRDPVAAAREAAERAGPVRDLVVDTGLAAAIDPAGDRSILDPHVGLAVANSRLNRRPPDGAVLTGHRTLATDATVRLYDRAAGTRVYHLEPAEAALEPAETATIAAAYEALATGEVDDSGDRGPGRAVRCVADPDARVGLLTSILRKHTHGWGVLADLFADSEVTDVFASAPVTENALKVRADGEAMATNARLTPAGARALASRFRRESGRAFSRASPTLDATARTGSRTVRATGVTDPVSDGLAFAFRAHDTEPWSLPELVANDTMPARAAGLLSLAVERGANLLVTGARGAGKTTLLGALLWAIPVHTRILVVEDTPELPVEALQNRSRDVQALCVTTDDGPGIAPESALRTALRLGEGALVVGEVRGPEARVLYEAMRVGAADGAVLGTVHGETAAAVRERVVSDLGVPASSFGDTDAVATVTARDENRGTVRRLTAIEEVVSGPNGPAFAPLYAADGSAKRLDRGDSRLFERLARAGESYADVRAALSARVEWMADVATGPTDPDTIAAARDR